MAVLGLSQEAEADAPTIELLTPQEGSHVPLEKSDDKVWLTWNGSDADGDALVYTLYAGFDKDNLEEKLSHIAVFVAIRKKLNLMMQKEAKVPYKCK